jgi:hypothetical protein
MRQVVERINPLPSDEVAVKAARYLVQSILRYGENLSRFRHVKLACHRCVACRHSLLYFFD